LTFGVAARILAFPVVSDRAMTYLALARKWRPRTFAEVSGQKHVVDTLVNVLDSGRVHHAFLLSGTRGVGKTTLARIFAGALNCEKGISSSPCGECGNCRAVEQGGFVDLIEVDAASRTRVEETRELLDNVQYVPTIGRFKIYLIDEVHMLSAHSFNALLKTLEEPPEHIKFLLATTDPQKLPVTVLSRCLQFHLRALEPAEIAARLTLILREEKVAADAAAVDILARAAAGSLRDALSLLDQAIAHGGGEVREAAVRAMLGMIDEAHTEALLGAIAGNDAEGALAAVAAMAEKSPDYAVALDDLLLCFHRLALAQSAPKAAQSLDGVPAGALALSGRFGAEDLQWCYQAALLGKRDLPLAPDPRSGFEMVLLRILAFRLEEGAATSTKPPAAAPKTVTPAAQPSTAPSTMQPPETPAKFNLSELNAETWPQWVEASGARAMVRQLALHSKPVKVDGDCVHLVLDNAPMFHEERAASLAGCLSRMTGVAVRLEFKVAEEAEGADAVTPAQSQSEQADNAAAEVRRSVDNDDHVRAVKERFGASVVDVRNGDGGDGV